MLGTAMLALLTEHSPSLTGSLQVLSGGSLSLTGVFATQWSLGKSGHSAKPLEQAVLLLRYYRISVASRLMASRLPV